MSTDLVPTSQILGEQFTANEAELLRSILDEESSLTLVIPDHMDPTVLWDSLEVCTKLSRTIQHASDKVKPLIGRMLIVVQDYPQLYQTKGYETYDKFLSYGVPELFGVSRSEAYSCKRIAERFPDLSTREFREIGVSKLQVATRAVVENPNCREKVLDKAREMSLPEFKSYVAKLTGSEPSDFSGGLVEIYCTETVKKAWEAFRQNKYIRAYVGSESDGEILSAMIQECSVEWMAQVEKSLERGAA